MSAAAALFFDEKPSRSESSAVTPEPSTSSQTREPDEVSSIAARMLELTADEERALIQLLTAQAKLIDAVVSEVEQGRSTTAYRAGKRQREDVFHQYLRSDRHDSHDVVSLEETVSEQDRPSDATLASAAGLEAHGPDAIDPETMKELRKEIRAGFAEGFEPLRRFAEVMEGMMRKASETAGKLRQQQRSRVR